MSLTIHGEDRPRPSALLLLPGLRIRIGTAQSLPELHDVLKNNEAVIRGLSSLDRAAVRFEVERTIARL